MEYLLSASCQINEAIEWNTDWKWTNTHRSSVVFNKKILSVDTTAQVTLTAIDEIQTVIANVKADHITAQHALKDLIGPGEQAEDIPWRERNVQEECQLAR